MVELAQNMFEMAKYKQFVKGKFKLIVIWLMHDSFPLIVLFLYNQLDIWLRLSRKSWIDSKIYMAFTLILNSGLKRPFRSLNDWSCAGMGKVGKLIK